MVSEILIRIHHDPLHSLFLTPFSASTSLPYKSPLLSPLFSLLCLCAYLTILTHSLCFCLRLSLSRGLTRSLCLSLCLSISASVCLSLSVSVSLYLCISLFQPRLARTPYVPEDALNLWPSCLHFPSAGVTGAYGHTLILHQCQGSELGFSYLYTNHDAMEHPLTWSGHLKAVLPLSGTGLSCFHKCLTNQQVEAAFPTWLVGSSRLRQFFPTRHRHTQVTTGLHLSGPRESRCSTVWTLLHTGWADSCCWLYPRMWWAWALL